MKIKVMEHGPFGCLVYKGVIDSLEEIPENYEKKVIDEKKGVTVYISPIKRSQKNSIQA